MKVRLSAQEKEAVLSAMGWVNKHFTMSFTVYELSLKFCISEYKLMHGFKQLFGITIPKYRTAKRLEYAAELLLEDELLINEVAYKAGFNDLSTFNRLFKTKYNMTPTAWKKEKPGCTCCNVIPEL